jgi:hypothetical protein
MAAGAASASAPAAASTAAAGSAIPPPYIISDTPNNLPCAPLRPPASWPGCTGPASAALVGAAHAAARSWSAPPQPPCHF